MRKSRAKQTDVARIGFEVLAQDPSPGIGDDAPLSKTLTLKDVNGDRSKISSASYDDSALHRISIADAVTNGKPTVILFATPAFCTSHVCGPSHQVVMSLAENYGDKVNFIHVEVYKEFQNFTPADAMIEWRLQTEPWLFFVDKNGKIVDKYRGGHYVKGNRARVFEVYRRKLTPTITISTGTPPSSTRDRMP